MTRVRGGRSHLFSAIAPRIFHPIYHTAKQEQSPWRSLSMKPIPTIRIALAPLYCSLRVTFQSPLLWEGKAAIQSKKMVTISHSSFRGHLHLFRQALSFECPKQTCFICLFLPLEVDISSSSLLVLIVETTYQLSHNCGQIFPNRFSQDKDHASESPLSTLVQ